MRRSISAISARNCGGATATPRGASCRRRCSRQSRKVPTTTRIRGRRHGSVDAHVVLRIESINGSANLFQGPFVDGVRLTLCVATWRRSVEDECCLEAWSPRRKKEGCASAPAKTTDKESVFYRAILQNLFFATLNTEMDKRGWTKEEQNFMAHSLYRDYRPAEGRLGASVIGSAQDHWDPDLIQGSTDRLT